MIGTLLCKDVPYVDKIAYYYNGHCGEKVAVASHLELVRFYDSRCTPHTADGYTIGGFPSDNPWGVPIANRDAYGYYKQLTSVVTCPDFIDIRREPFRYYCCIECVTMLSEKLMELTPDDLVLER